MLNKIILAIAVIAFAVTSAAAEERLGVKIYPGARADEATARYCKQFVSQGAKTREQGLKTEAFCFRTRDSFVKVAAFYRKQKGLDLFGNISNTPDKKAAVFCLPEMRCAALGSGLDVTVTTPWMDETGKQKDVLITIRENKRK